MGFTNRGIWEWMLRREKRSEMRVGSVIRSIGAVEWVMVSQGESTPPPTF